MIRKLLTAFAAFILSVSCAFGFSACNLKDGIDGKDGVNGINGTDGKDGKDGADGKDGVGVENAYIDENGDLIIELTNGKEINCGKVRPDGEDDGFTSGLFYSEVKQGENKVAYSVAGIGTASDNVIKIPSVYKGLPVVGVDGGAFGGCEQIKGVVIPDSVVTIGEKAFYECSALETISVGKGLTASGEYAFGRCDNLRNVNISDLKAWCEADFANAPANPLYFAEELYIDGVSATQLTIPAGTKKISDYAFYGCKDITEVTTGADAASIGAQAFAYCENLESVKTGDGVTSIGEYAFSDCYKLETVTFGNKLKSVGDYAFNRCYSLKGVAFPSGTESVGEGAFIECSNLKTVSLNDGLKSIGDAAFCGCVELEKLIMPDSVTKIGFGVLMFAEGGGFTGGAVYNNMKELVISNSITEIPDFAFNGCNMTDVVIGNSVETIRYSSFYNCSQLVNVVLPKSVRKIESYAFYRCVSLGAVYYTGTADEWSKISIGKNGNDISTATVYYYTETLPAQSGNFWHYVNGKATKW